MALNTSFKSRFLTICLKVCVNRMLHISYWINKVTIWRFACSRAVVSHHFWPAHTKRNGHQDEPILNVFDVPHTFLLFFLLNELELGTVIGADMVWHNRYLEIRTHELSWVRLPLDLAFAIASAINYMIISENFPI